MTILHIFAVLIFEPYAFRLEFICSLMAWLMESTCGKHLQSHASERLAVKAFFQTLNMISHFETKDMKS